MSDQDLDPSEIVATGILYKRCSVRSLWSERRVTLCGPYLYQYSKGNEFKGKFPIADSITDIVDQKEGFEPPGYFTFIVRNRDKNLTLCASSQRELILWVAAITKQVRSTGMPQSLKEFAGFHFLHHPSTCVKFRASL